MTLRWRLPVPWPDQALPPLVMGILNTTPDSFSDGGRFASLEFAAARAWEMARQGADILDIGGESTRPNSDPVPEEEEMRRVLPVIEELRRTGYPLPISIDTSKAGVARAAVEKGAVIINDVSAFRGSPGMAGTAARFGAAVVLMHIQGAPKNMQEHPVYQDVEREVGDFLEERIAVAQQAGVACERIIADPGIGFGKLLEHNLALLGALDRLSRRLGAPILLGASRKRFIGEILGGAPPSERLEGSLAAAAAAAFQDVEVIRVHDVAETVRFLRVLRPILQAGRAKTQSSGRA